MQENPVKQTRHRKKPEEIIKVLATKYRTSVRYVRMVISGDRNHESILTDYLEYKQQHNLLLKEVLRIVPFNN